jgi:hypothetical protein
MPGRLHRRRRLHRRPDVIPAPGHPDPPHPRHPRHRHRRPVPLVRAELTPPPAAKPVSPAAARRGPGIGHSRRAVISSSAADLALTLIISFVAGLHAVHPGLVGGHDPRRRPARGGYVRLLPSLQRGSATAPEMATVNSMSTPWHHSPGSQQPADARSRRPGWHQRPVPGRQLMPHSAEFKGAQIYRQQKARQTNTYSKTCLYRVLYGCGRMPGQRLPP